MRSFVPFFKTVWLALNPWRYDEVEDRKGGSVFKYMLSFVFLAFIISLILLIPGIMGFVNSFMGHFDNFNVEINTTMKSAFVLPESDPSITIDTRVAEGELEEGMVLITDDFIYSKNPLTRSVSTTSISEYENILNHPGFFTVLMILLLPGLLIIFYVCYIFKLLLIVLLASVLAFVVARLSRFEITFGNIFKCGMLAATIMVIIDLFTMPFGLKIYGAQYIAFAIFFIVGVIKAGGFEGSGRKSHPGKGGRKSSRRGSGKSRGGHYIEIKA